MAKKINLGQYQIGDQARCFIIAEAGTAHNGQLSKGLKLIEAAQKAGADCIKFQIVFASEIVHPLCGNIDLPGGKISIFKRFQQLEQPFEFYQHLKKEAESAGLLFLASVFGEKSAEIMLKLNAFCIKIASPELNHLPLLKYLAHCKLPSIVSTGVSRLADIETALAILGSEVALLHCVTSYPAPPQDYNLNILPNLKNIFNVPCGVSDHTLDPLLIPLTSLLVGCSLIEKHLTLSREDKGLDDPIALTPDDFKLMVDEIRQAETTSIKLLRKRLDKLFGHDLIEAVLGDGSKHLALSEKNNFNTTRRSIMAIRDIDAGEPFSKQNLAILRSEKNLSPGLEPAFWDIVLSRRASRYIQNGQGIQWDDIGPSLNEKLT